MIYPYPLWAPGEVSQAWQPLQLEDVPAYTAHQLAVMDLIEAIEQDRDPICSGRDGVRALEMVLGAYESQLSGRRVAFPVEDRTHPLERFQTKSAR